jgi:hypothetical protein
MAHIFVNSEKGLDVDGNVINVHHHVNSNPKVLGNIDFPTDVKSDIPSPDYLSYAEQARHREKSGFGM